MGESIPPGWIYLTCPQMWDAQKLRVWKMWFFLLVFSAICSKFYYAKEIEKVVIGEWRNAAIYIKSVWCKSNYICFQVYFWMMNTDSLVYRWITSCILIIMKGKMWKLILLLMLFQKRILLKREKIVSLIFCKFIVRFSVNYLRFQSQSTFHKSNYL